MRPVPRQRLSPKDWPDQLTVWLEERERASEASSEQAGALVADYTPETATLQDVADFDFTLEKEHHYQVDYRLIYRSATLTIGPQFAITHPAGPHHFTLEAQAVASGTVSSGTMYRASWGTSGQAIIIPDVPTVNANTWCNIRGTMRPTARGLMRLQFANETGSAASVVLKVGSTAHLVDLGSKL